MTIISWLNALTGIYSQLGVCALEAALARHDRRIAGIVLLFPGATAGQQNPS